MKLNLYVIKDTASGQATMIFTANNEKVLKRNLVIMFQQKQINMVNDHPEDKQVFKIGEYETETMEVISERPTFILNMIEIEEEVLTQLRAYKQRYDDLLSNEQKKEIDDEIKRNEGELPRNEE